MNFYILVNQITTLFLSLNVLTTLSFDSEIISYMYGGASEEVFFQVTNNQRTLVIKPRLESSFSNLLVITKNRKYYFDLKSDDKNPHQFIEVLDGIANHAMKQKLKTKDYEILEGEKSLLFINHKEMEVVVNQKKIKRREYLSKGVPIIYEGSRILN
jgi:type IV secretory pathway VirB9-like protein